MDTERIGPGSKTVIGGATAEYRVGSARDISITARGEIRMAIATMASIAAHRSATVAGQRPTVTTRTGTDTTPTGITLRTTVTTRTVTTTRRTVAIPHVHTAGTSSSLTI